MSDLLGAAPYMPPEHAHRSTLWRLARAGFRPWQPFVAAVLAVVIVAMAYGATPRPICEVLLTMPLVLYGPTLFLLAVWHGHGRERRSRPSGATVTTFPRLAAHREAARTGDWQAFAARRDLDPVTRDLDEGVGARRGRAS